MSVRVALAVCLRVLRQLRRDPRTVALVLVVPPLLLALLDAIFAGRDETFARVGVPLVGLFPFAIMFVVTSITMLRERASGTLDRLMTLPLAKLDLLLGYGLAFALVATVQALAVAAVGFGLLDLETAGPLAVVVALAVGNAVLGTALGLFASAFARAQFQAVQFLPAFVFPQFLLCGLFVPRELMAHGLELASWALPLTYAYDALALAARDDLGLALVRDAAVLGGVAVLALVLGAATLRRRTP